MLYISFRERDKSASDQPMPVNFFWENPKQKRNLISRIERRICPMLDFVKRLWQGEEGQDLVEYALLLVFLALAAITVLPTLGQAVNTVFSQSASTLTTGS